MGDYLTIQQAVQEASRAAGCQLQQIPGKKIMFHGRLMNGSTVVMCTPQAKLQPQGFCWTDLTEVQYKLLDSYDRAIVAFRLEGNRLTMCHWSTLRRYLTRASMKNNSSEGNHWKLYIYRDHICVNGNPQTIGLQRCGGNIWDETFG